MNICRTLLVMNTCQVILKTGARKGSACGRPSTACDSLCHRYKHDQLSSQPQVVVKSPRSPSKTDTNESLGVTVELAICRMRGLDECNVNPARCGDYNPDDPILQACIRKALGDVLDEIVEYTGPKGKSADFLLRDGKSISVKSNKLKGKKVAPNGIGQTSNTNWCSHFAAEYSQHKTDDIITGIRATIRNETARLLRSYIRYLFAEDYTLWIGEQRQGFKGVLFDKHHSFRFQQRYITLSNTKSDFGSLSVRYNNISLGEFQYHKKRPTIIVFRFNMANLITLLQ